MKKVVGIDIGTHSIKIVELEHQSGHFELTKCAFNKIVKGNVKETLKDLLSQVKLSVRRVNISMSGPSVIVRHIEMPPMKEEELKSAVRFEAEKYIPFNVSESIIDCVSIDKTASGTQRVLLVVAKKEKVESLLTLFKDLGLDISIIDIDAFALLNSFQKLQLVQEENSTYALVNMGAKFSNINIITDGKLYFTRDIIWGGMDITDRLRDAMGISFDEAEILKHKPGEKRDDVTNIVTPILEKLISQMRMSFDYFETQFGRNVNKLYISGGTSYLFNIVDFLKDNLGIDIMMWNLFESVQLPKTAKEIEESSALFTVAAGTALRK